MSCWFNRSTKNSDPGRKAEIIKGSKMTGQYECLPLDIRPSDAERIIERLDDILKLLRAMHLKDRVSL